MKDSSRHLEYRTAHATGRRSNVSTLVRHALSITAFGLAILCLPTAALAQTTAAPATELHIAAASDLQPVMPALAVEYQRQTGVHILASFGSSATLEQQLRNGDPQDLFLSADFSHAEGVVAAGLATEPAPVPYARGVLVLWARHDSPLQPLTLDSLSSPKLQRLAVANDLHAPYGLAATQALRSLHLTTTVQGKLAVGENIAQTAQFALSGSAQAGLISLTIANSSAFRAAGSFVRVPSTAYSPLRQCGVILKASPRQPAAEAFLRWLTSSAIQQRLPSLGLDPIE